LELQAQVISQIGGQTLPQDSWKNVRSWLKDLILASIGKLGTEDNVTVFIDCNPSFAAYTELAMLAAERLIVPCSSDGSSARAIDNIGALLYGIGVANAYSGVDFKGKTDTFSMSLPAIHSVLLNRSTLYSDRASKAFRAMFDEIKKRTKKLQKMDGSIFAGKTINFKVVPDNHSVAIVCSHQGKPLYLISPGKYPVHDTRPHSKEGFIASNNGAGTKSHAAKKLIYWYFTSLRSWVSGRDVSSVRSSKTFSRSGRPGSCSNSRKCRAISSGVTSPIQRVWINFLEGSI
jgi:hypothetical protein